jgi:hypothetical protein
MYIVSTISPGVVQVPAPASKVGSISRRDEALAHDIALDELRGCGYNADKRELFDLHK